MSADIVERLRVMAAERDVYRRNNRPMHVNDTMTTWLREAADEIEHLRQFAPAPHPDGHDL